MNNLDETQVLNVLCWPQSFEAIAPVLEMSPDEVAKALEEFGERAAA